MEAAGQAVPPNLYRRRITAWTMYDWANSAFATTILAAVLPIYYSQVAGATLPTSAMATAYWGAGLSLSLLIAAVLAPILGTISDISRSKKRFLALFVAIGVIGTGLLVLVQTGDWLMASLIFIVAKVGFNAANVFYDALLPHVARPEDRDRVSTRGYAMGYLGGGILLAINVVMIELLPGTWGPRLSFVSVALWWALFSLPIFRWVPEPPTETVERRVGESVITASFQRLRATLGDMRQYRELFKFLLAFLIYNDGIGTIIRLAAIYGKEIGITESTLIGSILLTQFVGVPFAILFGRLAGRIGAKQAIYIALAVYAGISVLGFFVRSDLHFVALACLVGTVQGGAQALSRSLFSSMIPKSKSGEFFGFYAVFEKGAAILGPLVFWIALATTGSSRNAILSIIMFFVTGALLLTRVDIARGQATARDAEAELARLAV